MIADSNNFFFECDRSNSNAKIPHATVGRAAPATNRRRQSFTTSLTCATRAGSSLLIAAVINTTHKTRPKAFNNIRALINRCPTGEPLHHSRLAFAAQPTMCEPAGEIPPDPDFARGVSLELESGVVLPDLHTRREPDRKRVVARPLEGLALGDEV